MSKDNAEILPTLFAYGKDFIGKSSGGEKVFQVQQGDAKVKAFLK
jgi:hypothetical protein